MIKEQIIYLDELDRRSMSPLNRSLIHDDTEILDIIIVDARPTTACTLIGNRFEWIPLIWITHEQDRIKKLDTLRIILSGAKMAEHVKHEIKILCKDINVEFHDLLLPGFGYTFFLEAQDVARRYINLKRDNILYYSAGTVRLPRFVLIYWLQQRQAHNFAHPKLSEDEMRTLQHQLYRLSKKEFHDYENVERRFFGNCDWHTYQKKHVDLLLRSNISLVSTQPFFDYLESFYCEKFLHPVACKSLPFFINNKNDNENIRDLGFMPYVGFDYSANSIDNFVERWQKLLDDNSHFLLDNDNAFMIMEKNKEIIEHNYQVLLTTNWEQKAFDKISTLSGPVRDFMIKTFICK